MDSIEVIDQQMDDNDDKDVINSDTDSDEDNDSGSDDNEEEVMLEINKLQEELSINAFDYSKHTKLIERLESCGELEGLRTARERMSKVYPLSPQLWLKWINDEIKIATTEDEKNNILKLFERSVSDYVSIDLWLEFVQYSIGLMDSLGVEGVRRVFERSLTYVGLNVDKGVLIWETFREFETFILQSMSKEVIEDLKKQIERIYDLFKRQLSQPLLGMENTFKEFEEWFKSVEQNYSMVLDFKAIQMTYEKGLKDLQNLVSYEESLKNSDPPHLEQYYRYIEFETSHQKSTPMRVQSIYERALTDNCLVADLWHKYTTYLDTKVVIDSILIPVYERAVRNCTWSSQLWISYIRALERLKSDFKKVMEVFETGLQSGFQTPNEYLELWLTFLDSLRRKTDFSNESDVKTLRLTFDKAVQHLAQIEGSDPNCSVVQYWAKIEAKFCKDIERSRKLWNDLMTTRSEVASLAHNWIAFSRIERLFGDEKHYRKVLMRGLTATTDWPESVGQILIEFEREEGVSIQGFDEVLKKYETVIKKINEKRIKNAEKEAEERKRLKIQKKSEKYELKRASKRTAEQSGGQKTSQIDSDGFKVPQTSGSVSSAKRARQESNESQMKPKKAETPKEREPKASESTHGVTDKGDDSKAPAHGVTYKGDGSKDLQTVFVSNLDFGINEDELREEFEKFGSIDDLRLVRNFKGLSKGYAYVEYASIESVREALKHDRFPLKGRPVFISEMGKRVKFNFSTSLEKHKLFVKNIPKEKTAEELKQIFDKYGTLKDIRLVTYRNGHSKGSAYVEYMDETSAQEAIKNTDGLLIGDQNISVAISNPNVRSNPREEHSYRDNPNARYNPRDERPNRDSHQSYSSNGNFESSRYSKTRIDAPMIPTSLRVQRRSGNGTVGSTNDSKDKSTPLNNSDFRSMLLGNK